MERICWDCGKSKPLSDFHRNASKKDGYETQCKICRNVYISTRQKQAYTIEKGRQSNLKRLYGITPEEYQVLFESQRGRCAVCGQPETAINPRTKQVQNLHVDHCHITGNVRALLCQDCNIAFGQLREDPERIRLLLEYALQVKKAEIA